MTDNWKENERTFQPRRKKPVQQQQQLQPSAPTELEDLQRRVAALEDSFRALYPNPPGYGD